MDLERGKGLVVIFHYLQRPTHETVSVRGVKAVVATDIVYSKFSFSRNFIKYKCHLERFEVYVLKVVTC